MKKYKVYCLRNKEKEIVYVGQTRQTLSRRLSGHKHGSNFPEKEFTIELIADFDIPEPMYKLEAMLIDQYSLVEKGWNRAEGFKDCPEQFDASGERNGFYGHTHREEVKKAIGKRSLGNKYAKGSKSRRGQKNSKEHNAALVASLEKKVLCLDNGIVYKSAKEAGRKLGLSNAQRKHITSVCKGQRKTTGGYRFVYVGK